MPETQRETTRVYMALAERAYEVKVHHVENDYNCVFEEGETWTPLACLYHIILIFT